MAAHNRPGRFTPADVLLETTRVLRRSRLWRSTRVVPQGTSPGVDRSAQPIVGPPRWPPQKLAASTRENSADGGKLALNFSPAKTALISPICLAAEPGRPSSRERVLLFFCQAGSNARLPKPNRTHSPRLPSPLKLAPPPETIFKTGCSAVVSELCWCFWQPGLGG